MRVTKEQAALVAAGWLLVASIVDRTEFEYYAIGNRDGAVGRSVELTGRADVIEVFTWYIQRPAASLVSVHPGLAGGGMTV